MAEPKAIGKVISYYSHISVAAIDLSTTDFTQVVDSMQIEHKPVKSAGKGDSIGIKVQDKVRVNDLIYKA